MSVKQPINYLDFNNPIHVVWRKGTPNDPFIDRLDITRVVNQRIALLEIPDELYRVRIANMFEINYEKFIKNSLGENEFYCDYTNGFVYFHINKEAETVSVVYKGRGVILYPSERIVHYDGTSSTQTLFEIIETSKLQVKDLIDKTQTFEEVLDNMIISTNLTKEATDKALKVTDESNKAIELIKDAYDTTVLIYMPFVQTQSEIAQLYPNPLVGWTVQVYDTGIRYRWNGQEWTPIDSLTGSIPLVTESNNGLMSKEEHKKLKEISLDTDYRTIVFICPQELTQGVQDPHVVFPHNGKIVDVKAYVSTKGFIETVVEVQKSSDFETWANVLDVPIAIEADSYKDNGNHNIIIGTVSESDIFRLNLPNLSYDTYNLTVNIKIQID